MDTIDYFVLIRLQFLRGILIIIDITMYAGI